MAAVYTQGPIGRGMIKTALAMIPATLALSGYNLVDAYFVGRLTGKTALDAPMAAMGFTLPVVMLIGCMFHGLGIGVSAPTAQALGGNKLERAAKGSSSGVLLILIISIITAVIGMSCVKNVFSSFGAHGEVLELVIQYMDIWYFGCATASIAMAGHGLLISVGDNRIASTLMMCGMLINAVLDPLFIFGWGFFPAMGIKGAALATIFAQAVGGSISMYVLWKKHDLIRFRKIPLAELRNYWSVTLRYALPASLGMLMMPIGMTVITRLTASFGTAAMAGCTAAGRLETIAFVVPMSLGMTLTPFIAQNYGARKYERIKEGLVFAFRFAFVFLFGSAVIFALAARFIAPHFCNSAEAQDVMAKCIMISVWGLAGVEIHRFSGFSYTGCGRPTAAAMLNGMRFLVFLIPFSLIAYWFRSLEGLFWARLAADVLSGVVGALLALKTVDDLIRRSKKNNLQ
ncbi:MAG: MATE family efflux transporter [Lentisphaeria bacterium]|nr:MATE family efflux transporter [Lentisphaeria bacterium]